MRLTESTLGGASDTHRSVPSRGCERGPGTMRPMTDASRPVALITMATGYVGPALARTMAERGYDLVLQGAAGDGTHGRRRALVRRAGPASSRHSARRSTPSPTSTSRPPRATRRSSLGRSTDSVGSIRHVSSPGVIIVGKFLDMTSTSGSRSSAPTSTWSSTPSRRCCRRWSRPAQGQIVVFTSATGGRPDPMTSIYGGTRAGANGIVRAVGLEHARDGVQVNAVGTNFMDFPGFLKASRADDPERREPRSRPRCRCADSARWTNWRT